MSQPWFRAWGWIHRPVAWPGYVVTLGAAAFCVQVFIAIDHRSHSVTDTLYGVFPFVVPTFLLWEWVAAKSGQRRR